MGYSMPTITWSKGTAYDFFISLHVLHHAAAFGLRPSWTAGVRQRLSTHNREILEKLYTFTTLPLDWISCQPEPRDAQTILHRLASLTPVDQVRILTIPEGAPGDLTRLFSRSVHGKELSAKDKSILSSRLTRNSKILRPAEIEVLLKLWQGVEESSRLLMQALQEFQQVFFSDEAVRLDSLLESGLQSARHLASRTTLHVLIEELSHGVRFEELEDAGEIILVPSFWLSPFVIPSTPREGTMQIVFGCRTSLQSISPGAETPYKLVSNLKSLADPTRLRILRYLDNKELTPTELSRLLRLRPPTILHHLQALRLAELVTIRISEDGEKRYTTRSESLGRIFSSIQEYIKDRG
jgi:DNA-binding transcriptional ArsR family regulator